MKVIGIGGSPRLEGNTNRVIDYVLDELGSHGIETEKIVLNQYKIGFCQAHTNCRDYAECVLKDDVSWILEKYCQADGIVLASPVYFGSISGQMKTFMDRTNFLFLHDKALKAKCAGLIAIAGRGGTDETIEDLMKFVRRGNNIKVFTFKDAVGLPEAESPDWTAMIEKARTMGRQMAEVLGQAPAGKDMLK